MSGVTVIELLITCVLIALVGAAGLSYSRRGGPATAAACAAPLETFLAHARAASVLSGAATRVTFDLRAGSATASWPEPPLRLERSCGMLAAAFGVAGRRSLTAVFYPSGTASPGHVLVGTRGGGSCRLTLGIRGGREKRCVP